MKNLLLLISLLIALHTKLLAQTDSLKVSTEIGIKGRRQTGNLNQLALNPTLKVVLYKKRFYTELQGNYQYLNVNNYKVNSDFWSSALYQYKDYKTLYPALITRYGFSKSYRINHSLFSGIGLGWNLRNKSMYDKIQLNAFTGYMNFEYETTDSHSSLASGFLFKLTHPISKSLNIIMEMQSYHSATTSTIWGVGNKISIQYKLPKNLFLNVTHNIIYNNKTVADIKKGNTILLFGIPYQYNK